jgi:hypothetical protein
VTTGQIEPKQGKPYLHRKNSDAKKEGKRRREESAEQSKELSYERL